MSLPSPVEIRPARDDDGAAIAGLIASVFDDYPGVRFLASEFPELAAPASHFERRKGCLWVAESAAAIVASFGVAPTHDPDTAEFLKVYVARGHRRQGIAHRLLALALGHAAHQGARRISLWSDRKFLDGHRFYERQGFVRGAGLRALHDASETLELNFRLDPIPDRLLR